MKIKCIGGVRDGYESEIVGFHTNIVRLEEPRRPAYSLADMNAAEERVTTRTGLYHLERIELPDGALYFYRADDLPIEQAVRRVFGYYTGEDDDHR